MKPIRPTLQITFALVFLTCALLLMANLLFGVFVEPDMQVLRFRKAFGESLATQAAALLQKGERRALELTLDSVRKQNPDIRSLAVRRADQTVLVQSGDHGQAWDEPAGERRVLTHLRTPLSVGSEPWGAFEMTYFPEKRSLTQRVLGHPLWVTLLFVAVLGALVYWAYMRRVLVHLDPTAVIPERVRLAFDIMTGGVVVLDGRGRILLANSAFRALQGENAGELVGKRLSALRWVAASLPAEEAEHPWARAMREGVPGMGYGVEVASLPGVKRKLVVNCAPITDPHGTVRGCLATFEDLTALHLANERLSETLAELRASRDEVQQKNIELEHMATHDALTGCLTRRAFFERMRRAWEEARGNGSPLTCLALDIDNFKPVNDRLGHAVGDRVIQEVGRTLVASLRGTDIAGRYGGDEFFVGMPGCGLDDACTIAEEIRRTIEQQCSAVFQDAGGLRVTVSIGVAPVQDSCASLAETVEQADRALYAAKSTGRNRVACADSQASSRPPASAQATRARA